MITYETHRIDSDKHCDQLKGNVFKGDRLQIIVASEHILNS